MLRVITVFQKIKENWIDIICMLVLGVSGYFVFTQCYANKIWKFIFLLGVLVLFVSIHYASFKEPKEYHIFKIRRSHWTDTTRFSENLADLRDHYSHGKDDTCTELYDNNIIVDSVKYYSSHIKATKRVIAVFGDTKSFAEYYRSLPPYYANDLLHAILDDHQTVLFLKDSQWDYKEEGLTESEIERYKNIRYQLQEITRTKD